MMLVAWELGIGSCPATVYEADRARELLGYPADMHCEFLLSFGYPAEPAALTQPNRTGGRKPVEDLVHWEGWSPSVDAEAGA
jgi:nitroreductase